MDGTEGNSETSDVVVEGDGEELGEDFLRERRKGGRTVQG